MQTILNLANFDYQKLLLIFFKIMIQSLRQRCINLISY